MIDAEIAQSYVNQTASQIAGTIAVEHGLIPNITKTSRLVGQYYQRDHARTVLGLNSRVTTEWELLTTLAREEDFLVSVINGTLNFEPAPTHGDNTGSHPVNTFSGCIKTRTEYADGSKLDTSPKRAPPTWPSNPAAPALIWL